MHFSGGGRFMCLMIAFAHGSRSSGGSNVPCRICSADSVLAKRPKSGSNGSLVNGESRHLVNLCRFSMMQAFSMSSFVVHSVLSPLTVLCVLVTFPPFCFELRGLFLRALFLCLSQFLRLFRTCLGSSSFSSAIASARPSR